jgi:large subunit ribosomal protein L9
MKVILQRSVESLGDPGDVVSVADGYARNYLMPRGLAVAASKGAVKHAESLKRSHESRTAKARVETEAVAAKLAEVALKVSAQAGDEGKLFGSVTAADLAEELTKAAGVDIDKKDVHLGEPIRSLGVHQFQVHLDHDVTADLSVEVIAAE